MSDLAPLGDPQPEVWLVRHGATEWSQSLRYTSVTDLPLLPEGEAAAEKVRNRLAGQTFARVLTSPRQRATRTAELAGYPDAEVDERLVEWAYGDYEGLTSTQIREIDPGWTLWSRPVPNGESPDHITARLDEIIGELRQSQGPALIFGHGHALRALAARWLGLEVSAGRYFVLGTATLSILGWDKATAAIEVWNS
ncbi:MAG: histidine phosphatase family protein [Geodermatophilaceae bacterium]|nr:histidine phosphatase family protein [Geodermatophilaceae bacterium]